MSDAVPDQGASAKYLEVEYFNKLVEYVSGTNELSYFFTYILAIAGASSGRLNHYVTIS